MPQAVSAYCRFYDVFETVATLLTHHTKDTLQKLSLYDVSVTLLIKEVSADMLEACTKKTSVTPA